MIRELRQAEGASALVRASSRLKGLELFTTNLGRKNAIGDRYKTRLCRLCHYLAASCYSFLRLLLLRLNSTATTSAAMQLRLLQLHLLVAHLLVSMLAAGGHWVKCSIPRIRERHPETCSRFKRRMLMSCHDVFRHVIFSLIFLCPKEGTRKETGTRFGATIRHRHRCPAPAVLDRYGGGVKRNARPA